MERDAGFWAAVVADPQVGPHVTLGHELDLEAVVSSPAVLPLASENGGFLFARLDGLGRTWELHTMYRPEAWGGREIVTAAKAAFAAMFSTGTDVIVTYEVEDWPRSQPPRSFRFEAAGDFAPAAGLAARLRTWTLTRTAWEASPARRRM